LYYHRFYTQKKNVFLFNGKNTTTKPLTSDKITTILQSDPENIMLLVDSCMNATVFK